MNISLDGEGMDDSMIFFEQRQDLIFQFRRHTGVEGRERIDDEAEFDAKFKAARQLRFSFPEE